MNNIELMQLGIDSSDDDYETMLYMKAGKKNKWCLFMGQLVIEKLLKALYAKKNKSAPHAPKSHDLLYLANKIGLETTENQKILLDKISDFNINARYDVYKKEFYAKCTDDYTEKELENIEEVRKWLRELLTMEQ